MNAVMRETHIEFPEFEYPQTSARTSIGKVAPPALWNTTLETAVYPEYSGSGLQSYFVRSTKSTRVVAAMRDLDLVLAKLGRIAARSRIEFDDEGEITIEWKSPGRIAIGALDGTGSFGYATLLDGAFTPGTDIDVRLASDHHFELLRAYLA